MKLRHFSSVTIEGFCCGGQSAVKAQSFLKGLEGLPWVSRKVGWDQLAISSTSSLYLEDIQTELLERESYLNSLWRDTRVIWSQTRPDRMKTGGFHLDTPFLLALQEALRDTREGGKNGQGFLLGDYCSTSFHFQVNDVLSDKGVLFYNLLTLVAPTVLGWLYSGYSVPREKPGRNTVLSGLARPERLPAPRWFADLASYQTYFESVPRLVSEVSPGLYEKDLVTLQGLRDWVSERLVWTPAQIHPSSGTVTLSCLPSLEPDKAVEVLEVVDKWLSSAVGALRNQRFTSLPEAVASGLIPTFIDLALPSTEEEWMRRWMEY